jgi:hypothetical protein
MVEVLYKVQQSWIKSFTSGHGNIDSYYLDTASPFSITNETGYNLTVSRKGREKTLAPGQTSIYELNTYEYVARYQLSTEKLKFTIEGYPAISGINMNKVQTKSFDVNGICVIADI